jgi:uncharacterized protein
METIAANLVRDVVQRLVSEFDPDQIILFGSHAWGKPDDGSDLDLLLLFRRVGRAQCKAWSGLIAA